MALSEHALGETVRAAARGDQRAWAALVQRFSPAIRRTARMYRLGAHDVDDVVQACWFTLLTRIHTLREPEAVGAWLVTTARRQALRTRQQEVREVLTAAPVPIEIAAADCTANAVAEAERVNALLEAVRRLPLRQRTLGMPIGSIGPTRQRGLRRLRGDARLTQMVAT
jgi:RNA polymerase sigma factor (sigma-70 family)